MEADGEDVCLPRASWVWATHENGEPNSDRIQHGWTLRGIALRDTKWVESPHGPRVGLIRAAGSWSLSNLTPRILKEDYSPGFFVDHFVKDLGIVLEEAARMQVKLPGVELAIELYRKLQGMGHGSSGTQALWLAVNG